MPRDGLPWLPRHLGERLKTRTFWAHGRVAGTSLPDVYWPILDRVAAERGLKLGQLVELIEDGAGSREGHLNDRLRAFALAQELKEPARPGTLKHPGTLNIP